MTTKLIVAATVSLFVLTLLIVSKVSNAKDDEDTHKYTICVEGTRGVKLRMLLVAKPTDTGAPTRESKIVTIPFETTINATSFYVWLDTLEDGASGKDGGRITGKYKIDGELQGGGFGGTIKKGSTKTFDSGNL